MKTYMNRIDREHHVFMLVAWDYLNTWLEKTNCLSPEERKRVKTATTHLLRASDSLVARMDKDYTKKLLREVGNIEISMGHKSKIKRDNQEETVEIKLDDIYDLASHALAECVDCKDKNFKKCDKYKLFMKLNIPVAQEQTDGCPYEN